jgi:hypothetical protein
VLLGNPSVGCDRCSARHVRRVGLVRGNKTLALYAPLARVSKTAANHAVLAAGSGEGVFRCVLVGRSQLAVGLSDAEVQVLPGPPVRAVVLSALGDHVMQ